MGPAETNYCPSGSKRITSESDCQYGISNLNELMYEANIFIFIVWKKISRAAATALGYTLWRTVNWFHIPKVISKYIEIIAFFSGLYYIYAHRSVFQQSPYRRL